MNNELLVEIQKVNTKIDLLEHELKKQKKRLKKLNEQWRESAKSEQLDLFEEDGG